jgi:hypothetical protein
VKRRQRIRGPHRHIAVRQAGKGIRAVLLICHSPAVTGKRPANRGDKRIFFCRSAIQDEKKDFLSILWGSGETIHRFPHRSENQNTRRLPDPPAAAPIW